MININSLPTPRVFEELDYEKILDANKNNFKTLVPDWDELESDEFSLVLEAFAYRELYLKAYYNEKAKAFFLSTASADDLDNYAVLYGVQRLQGSHPYATYTFKLDTAALEDTVIPKGLTLTDTSGSYEAKLREELVIPKDAQEISGIVDLQINTQSSEVETTLIITSLEYELSVSKTNSFLGGSEAENDEELKERILTSMADKSTAGSEESYKSFTLSADERVEEVTVLNGGAGIVEVYYYTESTDSSIETNIIEALNAKDVRPLTDTVSVIPVRKYSFSVSAELKIPTGQEISTIKQNAKVSLANGLASLKKIGTDITLSEINKFLQVDGVKEVIITSPTQNISIDPDQIGIYDGKPTIIDTIID